MRKIGILWLVLFPLLFSGCKWTFSLKGISIPTEAQTISVGYFQNTAQMVTPTLSSTFTEALQDRISRQTRLSIVPDNADLAFEGEIIGYTSTPAAVSGEEYTVRNNLTITVRVRYTNTIVPGGSFDRTFSAFLPYDSSRLLTDVESSLIPEIVDQLIEDIFNSAFMNW